MKADLFLNILDDLPVLHGLFNSLEQNNIKSNFKKHRTIILWKIEGFWIKKKKQNLLGFYLDPGEVWRSLTMKKTSLTFSRRNRTMQIKVRWGHSIEESYSGHPNYNCKYPALELLHFALFCFFPWHWPPSKKYLLFVAVLSSPEC